MEGKEAKWILMDGCFSKRAWAVASWTLIWSDSARVKKRMVRSFFPRMAVGVG